MTWRRWVILIVSLVVGFAVQRANSQPADFTIQFIDPNDPTEGAVIHEVEYRDLPEFPEHWFDEVARPWAPLASSGETTWPHCREAMFQPSSSGEVRARLIRSGLESEWSNVLPANQVTSSQILATQFIDPNDAAAGVTTIEMQWRPETPAPAPGSFQAAPPALPWEPMPSSGDQVWDHCRQTTVSGLGDGIVRSRFVRAGTPSEWSNPIFVPEPSVELALQGVILMMFLVWTWRRRKETLRRRRARSR